MTTSSIQNNSFKQCNVEGCTRREKYLRKGMCGAHRQRYRKYGDPLKGHEGRSSSYVPLEDRFWKHVDKRGDDECWEWTASRDKAGYGKTAFSPEQGKIKHVRAHQASWFLAHGYWSEMLILHSCDNYSCVNPRHLREGTPMDNMRDKIERNRHLDGDRHRSARLAPETVLSIRQACSEGMSYSAAGRAFGISKTHANNIANRRTWAHLP